MATELAHTRDPSSAERAERPEQPSTDAIGLFGIYLNDHRALLRAAVAVARRSAASNAGTELGVFLDELAGGLDEDLAQLERVRRAVGARPNVAKTAAALIGERLGRLKTNGRLRSYSPLSRQVELEGLRAAVQAAVPLWRTVAEWRERLAVLADVDVDVEARSARATLRSDGLDRHHREAVHAVLASRGRS